MLAAMKDYPEAQDILQTLGRKRLMEVRCVNKKHAKAQSDKEAAVRAAEGESASKRIVDKLRCDVKGIRNVLKKTRYVVAHTSTHCSTHTQETCTYLTLLPPPPPPTPMDDHLVWTKVSTTGRFGAATNPSSYSPCTRQRPRLGLRRPRECSVECPA